MGTSPTVGWMAMSFDQREGGTQLPNLVQSVQVATLDRQRARLEATVREGADRISRLLAMAS